MRRFHLIFGIAVLLVCLLTRQYLDVRSSVICKSIPRLTCMPSR
jgi:hypothetical protein